MCFFLPFGAASCEGQTSEFTGIELVTWTVDDRDEFHGFEQSFDLAAEVEANGSILATLTLAATVAGLAFTTVWWRPAVALLMAVLALLLAVVLLAVGANTLALDRVSYGYWLVVGLLGAAIVWNAVVWRRERRAASRPAEPEPP